MREVLDPPWDEVEVLIRRRSCSVPVSCLSIVLRVASQSRAAHRRTPDAGSWRDAELLGPVGAAKGRNGTTHALWRPVLAGRYCLAPTSLGDHSSRKHLSISTR